MLKKLVNGLEVAILPDEIRTVLPTMHLSDHMSNCPLLWESLQEGDNISNLICVNNNKQNIVSCLKIECTFVANLILTEKLTSNLLCLILYSMKYFLYFP